MTSMITLQTIVPKNTLNLPPLFNYRVIQFGVSTCVPCRMIQKKNKNKSSVVVSAVGDVSADSTIYLVGGAIAVALIGTAFPIFFSRKDTCPECDGAGFVRKSGVTLRANAARKDQAQIVCATCNGLGKLNQIDKKK
ncbi:hypothetical protein Lal_00032535 [Lupinus albus]|uniref:Putative Heat shock protein DnaJ, cysteine-rich n=1 Tax=Lupinus albus TaxID=3870 RepID=A0A6A5PIU9_LUPAL|nr:putative Heat shock protein DnaJ, cysteine-rich [Lupinus albus]KAF1897775.1 hypothetical protein Lal_00032535 [Lupinus albus]